MIIIQTEPRFYTYRGLHAFVVTHTTGFRWQAPLKKSFTDSKPTHVLLVLCCRVPVARCGKDIIHLGQPLCQLVRDSTRLPTEVHQNDGPPWGTEASHLLHKLLLVWHVRSGLHTDDKVEAAVWEVGVQGVTDDEVALVWAESLALCQAVGSLNLWRFVQIM